MIVGSEIERALREWREEGFALLPGVVPEDVLAALRARADDIVLGRVDPAPFFFQHDTDTGRYEDLTDGEGWVGPSTNYRKVEKLERDPIFAAWIASPLLEPLVRAAVGDDVVLYRAILMNKAARGAGEVGGTVLPWHQDAGALWGLDRDPELQLWTALDDAGLDAGCLEIVPRTHVGGRATPLGGKIPDEVAEAARAHERKVRVPAKAGDVVLIHNLVWHGSAANRTERPRRAMSACYMPASTRCVRKKRAPRTFPRVQFGGLGADPK